MIYGVGLMPDIAAKKIQKLAKIFLFRKKIFRLIHIQEVLYEQKVQRVYNILVPAMLRFHANVKVELTKQETKKLIKLRDIREKLAIIKIRKFFKRRKWTFKQIRLKVRRWKRQQRFSMPPSKKTKKQTINNPPKKVLTVTGNDWDKLLEAEPEETLKENELLVPQIELSREMMSTPDSLDNEDKITVVESNEPDEDAIARAKLLKELKEQRQAKLKISSISYNLKNHKESRLLPYLVKQETHEDSESNSSPFPSKPIFISLHVPQTFKIPTIKKPQTTPKRNVFQEPSYMRSTMCYSRRRWDAEMIFEQEEEQNSVSKSIEFNGLDSISKPTQTFLQKIKSPKKIDLDSKLVWRPNTQYEPDYIPSINNARYTAKPETHSKISTATHSPTVRATSYSTDMHTFTSPGLNSPPEYKIVHPFSLTFQGALPELSSFITQYSPRSQSKNKYLM